MTRSLPDQFRFETLIVGAANRLAVAASRAVAESPGAIYNPLFIYARPGLGKTHLLTAIGHTAADIDPRRSVEYVTLDELSEAFSGAVARGEVEAFRGRFAAVDVLLIDDVQFVSERREMQAELIRLVDALQTAGRQIVLASDRPPAELAALDERLMRRFAGGLVVDIAAPDYETRIAILRRRAAERGLEPLPGVLDAVACVDIDNVRELIGALNRVIALQAVSDETVDAAAVRRMFGTNSGAPEPEAEKPGERDEFADFLSEVAATVTSQVDSWRTRLAAAIAEWREQGFRTEGPDALLTAGVPTDPEPVIAQFRAGVERLRVIAAEAMALDPAARDNPRLRNPDDVPGAEAMLEELRRKAEPLPGPSPHWKLDDFLHNASNRLAMRAADAVAAEPGGKYNPFVIVGAAGTGKTHLLHGLGNALADAGKVVACLSAQDFIEELVGAIDADAVTRWRGRYREVGAFLLDDVHLIAGKERSQEELFLLFNQLIDQRAQLAFTSAVALASLDGVEPRLVSRLEGGLVVELTAPDQELRRVAIGRLLAARMEAVDPELVEYLAARPADSMRSALGLVQRVLSASGTQRTHPTAAFARQVLEGLVVEPPPRPGPSRASGVMAPPSAGIRSREKMVWDWPDTSARLIEEWR